MDTMDKNSEPYKDGNYSDLFEAAESSQIVGEEVVHYARALANKWAIKTNLEYYFEKGFAEGRAETREEGRAVGRAEVKHEIASKMLLNGFDTELISTVTGMSIDDIERLR